MIGVYNLFELYTPIIFHEIRNNYKLLGLNCINN